MTQIEHSTYNAGCTYFTNAHEIFIEIDHIQDYKADLDRFSKIEITKFIFPLYRIKSGNNYNTITRN
jgi:hypothetical protein